MKFKRKMSIILAITLLLGTGQCVFGVENKIAAEVDGVAYIKPDVTVRFNAEFLKFYNATGEETYPIIYKGATYLPIRAVADLMGENIEWRDTLKTIFIGKTLADPLKTRLKGENIYAVAADQGADPNAKAEIIKVYERPNFKVLYDFIQKEFTDTNGMKLYPIVYDGSTYLPLRAVSDLMGQSIEWDNSIKTVYVGSKTPISPEDEIKYKISKNTETLQKLYGKSAAIFNTATGEISGLSTAETLEEVKVMAGIISECYLEAVAQKHEVREFSKTEDLTESEQNAVDALLKFSELSEYYVLCMENIVYMATKGVDFSVMQDAFAQYAYDTTLAFEKTRLAIDAL